MAAKINFGDEELPVQDVVDILAKEVNRLKGNYSELNESLRQVEQRNLTETSNGNASDDMNLTLANTMSLARPNFDLVSVIPTFNGDERESVADFISKIEDVGLISGWTSDYKIVVAKLKLKGTAFSFSKSDEACLSATSLQELQRALEDRFKEKLPDHFYFEQLANIRQEKGENIENYSDRVKQLSKKTIRCTRNEEVDKVLREEGDRRAMEAFTRGLFGELGKQVRIRFPKTLQEAVTLAIAIRDVERRPSHEQSNSMSKNVFLTPNQQIVQCRNCNKFGHKQYECRVNRRVSFNLSPVNQQYNKAFSNFQDIRNTNQNQRKQCNFCKKLGHWENECRTKLRQLSQTNSGQFQPRGSYRGNGIEQRHSSNQRTYDQNSYLPRRTFEQQTMVQSLSNPSSQPTHYAQNRPQSSSENYPGSSSTAIGTTQKQH